MNQRLTYYEINRVVNERNNIAQIENDNLQYAHILSIVDALSHSMLLIAVCLFGTCLIGV